MRNIFYIVSLILFFSSNVFSYSIFEDKNREYTPDKLILNNKQFSETNEKSFGFSDSIFWIKINLKNIQNHNDKYFVLFKYQLMSSVDAFTLNDGIIEIQSNGYTIPVNKKIIKNKNIIFEFHVNGNSTKEVLIRIDNLYSTHLDYEIFNEKELYDFLNYNDSIAVFILTALSILVIYNLFLFFYSKDKTYGIYILYMLSTITATLCVFNKIEIINFLNLKINVITFLFISGGMLYIFAYLFNQTIFKEVSTKTTKIITWIMIPFTFSHFFIMLYSSELAMKIYAFYGSGFLLTLGLFYLTYHAYKYNHPLAVFVLIGWSVFLVSTIFYILSLGGFLSIKFQYAFSYGAIIEGLIFSLVLAYRIKEKEKLLIKQSKYAALGEMMDAIAHQWKQPLSIIYLYSSNLKLQANSVSENTIIETADNIELQIKHLTTTIDSFREFFRPQLKKENINIKDTINEVLILEKDILIKNEINVELNSENEIFYDLVKIELKHVIINLINNSKDAFIENNIQNRKIIIDLIKNEKHIIILVKDNAGGIQKENIDKIFNANFTTKEEGKGTGIGLYMSKQIIKKYNGKISAKKIQFDTNEFGTEFEISFQI